MKNALKCDSEFSNIFFYLSIYESSIYPPSIYGGPGDQTQGLVHARQVLYHITASPALNSVKFKNLFVLPFLSTAST
jgi:hypothetical protein